MKFLADGMLGKLARWLRMLGQDVIYSVKFNDSELLELAKKEERVLLTKDFELYKRAIIRGLDAYYVEGKSESERLAEVAKRYSLPLTIDMDKSHCPVCNTKLKQPQKSSFKANWRKTPSLTTINSGNAQTADKSTGREPTGNKSTTH